MTPRAEKLASPDFLWPWTVRIHRHANFLSALFVVAGITAWWFWAESVKPRKNPPVPAAARMVWLSEKPVNIEEAWRSDARAISSPVLFALPTPLGFSRGALSPAGLEPPPAPLDTNIALRGLPAPTSLVASIARTTPGEAAVAARSLDWPSDKNETARAATSSVIVVVCQLAGVSTQTRIVPIETNSVWADAQSWDATARVSLDAQGWPERVMLTKPSSVTNFNEQLVRLLSTMNFGSAGSREGRVVVRCDGNPDAPRVVTRKIPGEGGVAP